MAVYRFAGTVAADGVTPFRVQQVNVYRPSTSSKVTLYTDPSCTVPLSNPITTDANGFAQFCTNGVSLVDLSGTGLFQAQVTLPQFMAANAPLNTGGTLPLAYTSTGSNYLFGNPATAVASNVDRRYASVDSTTALTSGVMTSAAVFLPAGFVVTNLTFVSGATAAATPTHWFFALYSAAATPALLAQTADQTSTAWAASTAKTVPLTTPQTITTSGVYRAGIVVVAGTVPSMASAVSFASAGGITSDVPLAQTSGSGLVATAPPTITGATVSTVLPYVELS